MTTKVTGSSDFNGRMVMVRLRNTDPNPDISVGNQMFCHISEISAQGVTTISGPKNTVSRFIPWWNIEYIQVDAAVLDEEGGAAVEVGGYVQ
ncbi:MAG: hypothetical protein E6R03_09115 [Hyphomicrobiaceae bacterium]|nr:MAG: hypothetical protein E6R03_09115 [Hyphomicrobiaceae bacterium]